MWYCPDKYKKPITNLNEEFLKFYRYVYAQNFDFCISAVNNNVDTVTLAK